MKRKKKLPFNKDKISKMSATGGLVGFGKDKKKEDKTSNTSNFMKYGR